MKIFQCDNCMAFCHVMTDMFPEKCEGVQMRCIYSSRVELVLARTVDRITEYEGIHDAAVCRACEYTCVVPRESSVIHDTPKRCVFSDKKPLWSLLV